MKFIFKFYYWEDNFQVYAPPEFPHDSIVMGISYLAVLQALAKYIWEANPKSPDLGFEDLVELFNTPESLQCLEIFEVALNQACLHRHECHFQVLLEEPPEAVPIFIGFSKN